MNYEGDDKIYAGIFYLTFNATTIDDKDSENDENSVDI